MLVSHEAAAWTLRVLLGREPESEAAIEEARAGHATVEDLRTALLQRPDVKAAIGTRGNVPWNRYRIPPFLMRPPASPTVPWRFESPTLARPVSQLCTAAQMREPDYLAIASKLGSNGELHRKLWEFGYIASALRAKGALAPGRKGLGFGTGQEPLPAFFAAAGATILATDMPGDMAQSAEWLATAQWTDTVERLWKPEIIARDEFMARVAFRPVDMNAIDPAYRDFDFNWSSSCMDHLGSIQNGLDFVHACLETLRPGGVAVHTTEFNIDSDTETFESPSLTFFRKRDFETLFAELLEAGHSVEPLNTWPGTDPEDEYVDTPPYGMPHLKLTLGDYRTTSIGFIVTKKP